MLCSDVCYSVFPLVFEGTPGPGSLNSMDWKTDLGVPVHLLSNAKEVQRCNGQENIGM